MTGPQRCGAAPRHVGANCHPALPHHRLQNGKPGPPLVSWGSCGGVVSLASCPVLSAWRSLPRRRRWRASGEQRAGDDGAAQLIFITQPAPLKAPVPRSDAKSSCRRRSASLRSPFPANPHKVAPAAAPAARLRILASPAPGGEFKVIWRIKMGGFVVKAQG